MQSSLPRRVEVGSRANSSRCSKKKKKKKKKKGYNYQLYCMVECCTCCYLGRVPFRNNSPQDTETATVSLLHSFRSSITACPLLALSIILQRSLCCILRFLEELFGHLFVSSLAWPIDRTDPRHFQFKLLVLAVFVCNIDDASCFFHPVKETQSTGTEVELFELRFCRLSAFAGSSAIVTLFFFLSQSVSAKRNLYLEQLGTYPVKPTGFNHV